MNPVGGRFGARNTRSVSPAARATASAAALPLRTAPSMVAGQPVAVQSPARNTRGQMVCARGRYASTPGCGEYVAWTSLITVDFTRFASRAPGKNSRSSPDREIDDLLPRFLDQRLRRTHHQFHVAAAIALRSAFSSFDLWNIHWMVRSSSTA